FTLITTSASNRGQMDIYVDDVKITTLNLNGAATVWQKTWTSPTFTNGIHTVRFVNVSSSAAYYVDVDGITIFQPAEVIPPAAISDLAAVTGASTGSVNLSWTAPGDDGSTGTAASYLVRRSASAISDEAAWNAATPVTTGLPPPLAAGSPQSMTITGLTPGTTYFFAVRAQDEVPNLGGLSNSPSAQAKPVTPAEPGTYDDPNPNFLYSGAWLTYSGAGPYLNTLHFHPHHHQRLQPRPDGHLRG
ncbi:MAG: Ig-like domain-containing protein, partial [Anaerolineaceae bacterium]